MPLFGPPNIEKLVAKGDVKGLVKALRYKKDASVRRKAAVALGEIGGAPAVEPLTAALGDSAPSVGLRAARSLGQLGDARAVESLIDALENSRNLSAIAALGQIGDARAVEPLIAACKDRNSDWADRAKEALIQIGEPAVGSLIVALENWEDSAPYLLGQIGSRRAVEPLIVALEVPKLRETAIAALGQIGDKRAATPLASMLPESSWSRRKAIVSSLDQLDWDPGSNQASAWYHIHKKEWAKCIALGEAAVDPLIAALADSHYDTLGVIRTLGKIGDVRVIEPLIAALPHKDRHVRVSAGDALIGIGQPAVDPLISTLNTMWRTQKREAIRLLGEIRDARAVEPLVALLEDEDVEVRREAVRALGKIGDIRAVEPLVVALEDKSAPVRRHAASALGEIGDARALEPLIDTLRVENIFVYQAVLKALAALYKSGTLTESQKQRLLQQESALQRKTTVRDHDDHKQGCFHDDSTRERIQHDDFGALI